MAFTTMDDNGGLTPSARDDQDPYNQRRSANVYPRAASKRVVMGPPANPVAILEDSRGFMPSSNAPSATQDSGLLPDAPQPIVRQPLGTLVANQPEQKQRVPTAAADNAPPVAASTDDSAQGGLLPSTTKAAPSPQPQQPQPPSSMGLPPQAFSPDAANGVATAPVRRQQPLDAAQGYANLRAGLGPEPTWNTLPSNLKHHGGRKALDTIGSVLYGGLTLNPMAGLALHQQLSRGPLREAQNTYESQAGELEGGYKRQMELAKQGTAEDVAQTRELTAQQRLETSQRATSAAEQRANELGKKITRYYKDATGNWKGEQADGQIVDAVPPPDQRENAAEKFDDIHRERKHEADVLGLTGDDRKFFEVNGKLREPGTNIHIPSAESQKYDDWKKQFKQQNGREPSAEEIAQFGKADRPPHAKDRTMFEVHWQGMFGRKEKEKDAKRRQIVKNYGADTPKGADGLSVNDRAKMQRDLDGVEAGWEVEKQQLQNEKDAEAEQYGIYDQGKPAIRTTKGKTVRIGDQVVVGDKSGTIVGVRNGKPVVRANGK